MDERKEKYEAFEWCEQQEARSLTERAHSFRLTRRQTSYSETKSMQLMLIPLALLRLPLARRSAIYIKRGFQVLCSRTQL